MVLTRKVSWLASRYPISLADLHAIEMARPTS